METVAKMKFKLVYGNHWNFGIVVADTFLMLQGALHEMGFQADIEKEIQIEPGVTYVFIEGFDKDYAKSLQSIKDIGSNVWIIATEEWADGTFNLSARQGDNGQYSKSEYWDERFQAFMLAIESCDLVWHLSEQQAERYKNVLEVPVEFLPHGFTDNFASVRHREHKDIDFVFTGTLTDHRRDCFNYLENKGYKVVYLPVLTASFHRDDVVSRAKIGLNVKQSKDWPQFSNSRANYHLCNQSSLISEYCSDTCAVADFIHMPSNDFLPYVEWFINDNDWNAEAKKSSARYRTEHRLSSLIESVVRYYLK